MVTARTLWGILDFLKKGQGAHVGTDPTKVYIMDTRGAGSAPDPAVGAGSVDSEQRAGGAQNTQSLANSLGDALLARGLDVKSGGAALGGSGGTGLLTGSSYLTEAEWTQIATLKPKLIDEYPELESGTSATGAIVSNTPAPPEAPASETNPTWLTTPSRGPASLDEEPAALSAPVVAANNPTVAAAPSSRNTQNKSSSLEAGGSGGTANSSNKRDIDPTAGYLPTPIAPPAHSSGKKSAPTPSTQTPLASSNPMATAMANNRGLATEGAKSAPKPEQAPPPNPSAAPSSVLKASTNTALTNELYGLIQFARFGNNPPTQGHSGGDQGSGVTEAGFKRSDGTGVAEASAARNPDAMKILRERGISATLVNQVEKTLESLNQKIKDFDQYCSAPPADPNGKAPSEEQCTATLVNFGKKEKFGSIEDCLKLKTEINTLQITTSLLIGTAINNKKEKDKKELAKLNKQKLKHPK